MKMKKKKMQRKVEYSAIDDILPRSQGMDIDGLLGKFSDLIEDAVNFGTHLMRWDSEKRRVGDENLPPLLFLRNILELVDAISILVRQSSIDSCKPLLRSLLENTLGLEYMLETNFQRRALSYIVWLTHKNLKLYDKLTSTTLTGKQFKREIEKDRLVNSATGFFDNPRLSFARMNAHELLRLPQYLPIEAEFERISQGTKNPYWYSLFGGPSNIETLAKYLKLNATYEILYRDFSGHVHATSLFQSKIIPNSDGTIAIVQIRYPEDAQSVTQNTINIIIMAYLVYYKNRTPEREEDFQRWYLAFRNPYQDLFKGKYLRIEK